MEIDQPDIPQEIQEDIQQNFPSNKEDFPMMQTVLTKATTKSQELSQQKALKEGCITGQEKHWKEYMPKEYWDYEDVFTEPKGLPPQRPWDLRINFKEGYTLPKTPPIYRLTEPENKELNKWIDEQLHKGYISKSTSKLASPVFFVGKKDGGLRLCTDYRAVNNITEDDVHPLPLTGELLDKLQQSQWFTAFDLRAGYNNVQIVPEDRWKAAIKTPRGIFEPNVMYFGLKGSPPTFQRMMTDILRDRLDQDMVNYMDDVMTHNQTFQEHVKTNREFLQRCRENRLYLKPSKCYFHQQELDYLGMHITKDGITMDESKTKAITEWPTPTTPKQIRQFLGFAGFYRHFIPAYSDHTKPLTRLLRKDIKWEWTEKEQESFDRLKDEFKIGHILVLPDPNKQFTLETDASDYAIAGVISQENEQGKLQPIAFFSRSLVDAEKNYPIYDKEMLAIIASLKHW